MTEQNLEQSIFLHAIGLASATDRAAYLDEACRDNPQFRAELDALLAAHDRLGEALPPRIQPEATRGFTSSTETAGAVIGPYKLLEQSGEGGMGTVWMAEQREPIHRRVAVKVIKAGMDSKQVLARFDAERQALALMDHPNIARVFDAGTTETGRPYFVMELVNGVPLTKYCDEHRLTPRQRMELFVPVCQAIQHAHQKGIIHRDIKPSNVLVALYDGKPVPKIIDFGVAKATGQQLTEHTLVTGFGAVVGTLEYMSPEQAELNQPDIDTRSDIYSLGVLLYELLTGTTPLEKKRLNKAAMLEVLRLIREEEPPTPSTRLSSTEELPSVAAQRQTEPARLTKLVRGELDWIVMKCLEKDRNRRYGTADGLARDIERHLHDEPVQACPPSAWYRFRKLARRKKTTLAIASCLFLALVGIAGALGWAIRDKGAREEEIERERLTREGALDQTVERTLDETGPLIEQGKWPEALAVAERADKLLAAAGRTERPARLLELRKELTMAEHLDEIYRRSIMIISTRHETEHPVQAPRRWSFEDSSVWGGGQDSEFAKAFRNLDIDVDALLPVDAAAQITRRSTRAALIRALDGWAAVRRRDRGQNDPSWKTRVEIACQADPDPWRNRCRQTMLNHDRQALEQLADAAPIRQVPPATLCLLGMTLKEVGSLDKAMGLLRRAQQQYPDDLWLNHTLGYFSYSALQPPRLDDALRFYTVVSALRPRFAPIHLVLGNTLMNKGAPDEAMTEFSKAIELDPTKAVYWQQRGWNYLWKLRDYDKARFDSSEALRLNPKLAQALFDRAVAYRELHQYDKCLGDLDKIIELHPKNRPIDPEVYNNTARYLAAASEPEERDGRQAAALAQLALKTVALAQVAVQEMPTNANCWNTLGVCYQQLAAVSIAAKQFDEAEKAYRDAIAVYAKLADPHKVAYNSDLLGFLLNSRGKFSQAAQAFRKAMTAWHKLHTDSRKDEYRKYESLSHGRLFEALLGQARQIEKDVTLSDADRRVKAQACRTEAKELVQDGITRGLQTPLLLNNTARRLATDANTANRDPAFAGELAKMAVEREPKQGMWWNTLGVAQYRARDWKAAIEALGKSMELRKGGDSFDWFFLAMAQWQLGETEKARTWFNQAVLWMDKHEAQNEELRRFRGEAAELLGVKDGQKEKSGVRRVGGH